MLAQAQTKYFLKSVLLGVFIEKSDQAILQKSWGKTKCLEQSHSFHIIATGQNCNWMIPFLHPHGLKPILDLKIHRFQKFLSSYQHREDFPPSSSTKTPKPPGPNLQLFISDVLPQRFSHTFQVLERDFSSFIIIKEFESFENLLFGIFFSLKEERISLR